ncbi:hypothetical protein ASZ90_014072 [hydrocarbon metagenome]|uniref:Uncharacterized protein n=1 Tax=hydrocarbon metagenome TaxID=938273 RepID=A0A0W8F620_9ZZZZ
MEAIFRGFLAAHHNRTPFHPALAYHQFLDIVCLCLSLVYILL